MSRRALAVVAALAVGILAGVAWIVFAEPVRRVPEPGTPIAALPSSFRSESIETAPPEPASTLVERDVVQASAPRVEVTSATIAPQRKEDARVVLFGMVTDASGHATLENQDLYVGVMNDAGKRASSKIEAGHYSIAGLEPGDWQLSLRKPGFRDFERHVTLSKSEAVHREDFVLERSWNIAILVQTPEGKNVLEPPGEADCFPLLWLCAVATKDSPGERLPATELMHFVDYGVGRFMQRVGMPDSMFTEIPQDAIGYLMVLEPPPIHVSLVIRQFVIETKRIDSPVQSLTFKVSIEQLMSLTSSLVLRVVDGGTGQPIEGASIELFGPQSGMMFGPKSGPDGLVRFCRQVPGQYSVRASVPGHAMETRLVDLAPGRETDLGDFSLSSPNAISGRITDSEGHPVAAQPSLHPYYENDPVPAFANAQSVRFKVDGDGRFSVAGCAPGRYLLLFGAELRNPPAQNEPEWTIAPVLIDTRSGPAEHLEIVLARGAELTMKPTSKDVVGMGFRIMTTDGLPYRQGSFYETSPRTLRIAPGSYDLVLIRDSKEIRRVPIHLSAQGTTEEIAP
jgi:hypothetical protein